jgi:hemophore-related protein
MSISLQTMRRAVRSGVGNGPKPMVVGLSAAALTIALAGCGGSETQTATESAADSATTTTSAAADMAQTADCTAGNLARIQAGVSSATADYLLANDGVNEFFTDLKGMDQEMITEKTNGYLDDNPKVKDELSGLRQPLRDFKERCDVKMPGQ